MSEEKALPPRREQIITAAERIFDAKGYAAATMEAVAEEAHVAKGSIYNHFQGKHDLFMQVFAHAVSSSEADTARLVSQAMPASDTLRELLDYWFKRLGDYRRIGRLVLEFWVAAAREGRESELATSFKQMYARWRELLGSIIAQGVASGEFLREFDTPVAAALIMAMLDGITIQTILDVGITVDPPFVAALKRAIMAGLGGGNEPGESESSLRSGK